MAELRESAEVTHEDWLVTGAIQDPVELGRRLAAERFDAVVVEADFLFGETFDAAPRLGLAGICRSATNQVDIAAASERGVIVVNTPGRNANAVAEHTLALMLAVARRIPEAHEYVRGLRWESPSDPYRLMRGTELGGRTVGVVGLGAVGRRVAALCNGFGMRVLGYDPAVSPVQAKADGAVWAELDFLLASADIVTLHAAPPGDGEPLLGAARLGLMKPGAVLINTASAALVDEAALAAALRSGRLSGAASDVFPTHPVEPGRPLLSAPGVVLTPHIGGATAETVDRHSASMAVDLIRYGRGERPLHMVNGEVWERRRRGW
jgi:D-3-phosphoglycerate dehydrogenase